MVFFALESNAQNGVRENLPDYYFKKLHFGYLFSFHLSNYDIKYNDKFITPEMDSIHSIVALRKPGLKIGFVLDYFLMNNLTLRILPTIGIYEFHLKYRFINGTSITDINDPTFIEVPILLKAYSMRRKNASLYFVAGINPSIEAINSANVKEYDKRLNINNFNIALELGVGFDVYFTYFKFSPEIRYSYGLNNKLTPKINPYNINLQSIQIHNLSILIYFEGGPTFKKDKKKKKS